jgi:hypothetical protein
MEVSMELGDQVRVKDNPSGDVDGSLHGMAGFVLAWYGSQCVVGFIDDTRAVIDTSDLEKIYME